MTTKLALLVCTLPASVAVVALPRAGRADDVMEAGPRIALLVPLSNARLIGASGGGGGGVGRAPSGAFLGADAGWGLLFASGDAAARGGGAFGASVGYQFRSGLALEGRFDDLGVTAPDSNGSLLVGSVGARYVLPLVVMPFVEALVGPAFYGSHATPAVGLGFGLALPIGRHLAFDLTARDWIADLDGDVRHTATFEVGITIGFGGR